MSHAALGRSAGMLLLAALLASPAPAIDPHLDPNLVEGGCPACHQGHGVSRSPMLRSAQTEVCYGCHDSQSRADRFVREGLLAPNARPQLLAPVRTQPFVHPLDEQAFSRYEPGVVTCSSCHSPHRGSLENLVPGVRSGGRLKLSTRNPNKFEYELCQRCHGSAGVTTQSLLDISRLTNPNSRSFHPLEAPSLEGAPSTLQEFTGLEVNCTDCHGNSDPTGPRGPHGSAVRYILRQEYITVDGAPESPEAYALCYQCHDRQAVLEESPFPLHRLHVVDERTSCATCHNGHGSVENRSLIRFGEETNLGSATASSSSGRLAFESVATGAGTCYVQCHGVDHSPARYGSMLDLDSVDALSDPLALPASAAAAGSMSRPGQPFRPPFPPGREPQPFEKSGD